VVSPCVDDGSTGSPPNGRAPPREPIIARMRLAILGLGLIGGSVARALRAREPGTWSVVAWSPSGRGPAAALDAGAIAAAAASAAEAVSDVDLVLLGASPLDCLALIDELGGPLRGALPPGAVVTDAASTKRAIVERARANALPFVGGHPMAGRETSGFAASDADLFVDRPWVVCPAGAGDDAVDRVERLARAVGAVPVRIDAAEHDAAVAAVSHLPLVLSASLAEAVLRHGGPPHAAELAASGWRDMTRLARGDAAMGAGIAATNADLLAHAIRSTRAVLDAWLADLDGAGEPDAAHLEARFTAARRLVEPGREEESDDG
jgi:prephenate dehydrogenase